MWKRGFMNDLCIFAIAMMVVTDASAIICPKGTYAVGGKCYPKPGSVGIDAEIAGLNPDDVGNQVVMTVRPGAIGDEDVLTNERKMPGVFKCQNNPGGPNFGTFDGFTGSTAADAELITYVNQQGKTLVPLVVEWTSNNLPETTCPPGQNTIGFIPDKHETIIQQFKPDNTLKDTFLIVCEEENDIHLNNKTKRLEGNWICSRCPSTGCEPCVAPDGPPVDGFQSYSLNGACQDL
ncbi:MAG: hypothetical protein L0287_27590 [Anaerolineae bacterium]|nr:hypothetical protein [Anaerolineae bacterium]